MRFFFSFFLSYFSLHLCAPTFLLLASCYSFDVPGRRRLPQHCAILPPPLLQTTTTTKNYVVRLIIANKSEIVATWFGKEQHLGIPLDYTLWL